MPSDRRELQLRIAATTDADTSRGISFNQLFGMVRDHLGDEAARSCDPQRKGSRVDFFSYPIAEYLRIAWDAADMLEKRLGGVEAVFGELGRRTVRGFLGSVLGKTMFSMAGKDPRRLVAAGPSAYRAATSYGERTVEWLGDKHALLTFRRDFMVPAYHRGVMLAALEMSDARNPRVDVKVLSLIDAQYDLRWD